ncbi:hypothetical protein V6Z11_A01G199100 [Gossypium hirsutum]
MTRIKRGYITRRRQTKISLFASSFREAYSRLTRTITQQRIKVLVLAQQDRDRDKKERDFCRLILAQIAISNRNCIYMISNNIRK